MPSAADLLMMIGLAALEPSNVIDRRPLFEPRMATPRVGSLIEDQSKGLSPKPQGPTTRGEVFRAYAEEQMKRAIRGQEPLNQGPVQLGLPADPRDAALRSYSADVLSGEEEWTAMTRYILERNKRGS